MSPQEQEQELKEKHEAVIKRLQLNKQVIIYNNRLCITRYNGNSLVWVKDYYLYKINEKYTEDNWFHINLNYKQLINFGDGSDDDYKTTLYYGFLNSVQFIDDTSDENLGKVHLELLKKCLINKALSTISKDDIIARETQHRNKILQKIVEYINKVSNAIYNMVEKGMEVLHICFNEINEKTITNDGKLPQYTEYPCSDGRIRSTFSEYFYFLLENEYIRKTDDISYQEWIGLYLIERCNAIFPHIKFIYKETDTLLPIIILHLNIDTSDSLL
jgi:hypothetical protein